MMRRKTNKTVKSINFDTVVLDLLELRARSANTSVSNIVNRYMRNVVMDDVSFAKHMARQANRDLQKWILIADRIQSDKEVGVVYEQS